MLPTKESDDNVYLFILGEIVKHAPQIVPMSQILSALAKASIEIADNYPYVVVKRLLKEGYIEKASRGKYRSRITVA